MGKDRKCYHSLKFLYLVLENPSHGLSVRECLTSISGMKSVRPGVQFFGMELIHIGMN